MSDIDHDGLNDSSTNDSGLDQLADAGDTLAPGGVPGAAGLGGNGVRAGVLSGDDDLGAPDTVGDPGADVQPSGDDLPGNDVLDGDTAADGDELEGTTGGLT